MRALWFNKVPASPKGPLDLAKVYNSSVLSQKLLELSVAHFLFCLATAIAITFASLIGQILCLIQIQSTVRALSHFAQEGPLLPAARLGNSGERTEKV